MIRGLGCFGWMELDSRSYCYFVLDFPEVRGLSSVPGFPET